MSAIQKTNDTKVAKKPNTDRAKLIERAGKGDQSACEALYALMDEEGTAAGFIASLTSTARQVRDAEHDQLIVREAFRRKQTQMRDELGFQTGTPLERLLIERIVMCWNHVHHAEVRQAQAYKKGTSLAAGTYYDKCVDRAQKRYLAGIQSLALVRRLQIPAVQVNIGEKQINVVQSGTQANNEVDTPIMSA